MAGTIAAHAAQGRMDGAIEQDWQRLRMSVFRTVTSNGRAVLHSVHERLLPSIILRHLLHFQSPTVVVCTIGCGSTGTGTSTAIVEVAEEEEEEEVGAEAGAAAAGSFSGGISM